MGHQFKSIVDWMALSLWLCSGPSGRSREGSSWSRPQQGAVTPGWLRWHPIDIKTGKPPKPGGTGGRAIHASPNTSALSTKAGPEVNPGDSLCCEDWLCPTELPQQPNLYDYLQAPLPSTAEHASEKRTCSFSESCTQQPGHLPCPFLSDPGLEHQPCEKAKLPSAGSSDRDRKVPHGVQKPQRLSTGCCAPNTV